MQEIIAVYSDDMDFSENLCRKLHDRGRVPYQLKVYRNKEELQEFINEHPQGVILIDRQAADPEILKLKARQFLYLTDVRGYPVIDGIRTVFKYQAVSGIETELLDGLAKGEEDTPEDGTALYRAKYIGVASPIGRCLKTSFCLTLGQLLSQKEHVLYMNLEPCSGFTALFEKEFPKDLSDLLYAYETGKPGDTVIEYVETFHGLDFVPPVCAPEDIYRTDPALIRKAVTDLQRAGAYDTVILDLSSDLRLTETLIPMCRKLYLPARKELISDAKVREYRMWLDRILDGNAAVRTEELILPFYQSFSTGKQYLEQLLWSELGDFVRSQLRSAG